MDYISTDGKIVAKNSGPTATNNDSFDVGKDLDEAIVCCQVVEKAAKCYIELKKAFDIKYIPKEDVELAHH